MKILDSITNDPKQSLRISLDDGSKVDMTLVYKETQQGWFYSLSYGGILNVNNRRVVNSPNMLRAFRNILPFGLSCTVSDGLEPVRIDDFSGGRASLYILNSSDIVTVEQSIIPEYVNA